MIQIVVPEGVKKLAKASKAPIYIVGGYVRNQLAGFGETDMDLCGPAAPQDLGLDGGYRIKVVNHTLGTAMISSGDEVYEYTPFRTEKYADGGNHKPAEVLFTSEIKQDAIRRDFACNSIYYDITNQKIIDLLGGVGDIERKVIRSANPAKIFADDGLRILRLVRMAGEFGFEIDKTTELAAKNNVTNLKDISGERKRDELNKILLADQKYGIQNAHYRAVKLLGQLGAWEYLLSPIDDMHGIVQPQKYHKYDVYEHTMQCVKYANPKIRLAALLHDIGKPYCFREFGNFKGHEKHGLTMVSGLLGNDGLKYSNKTIDEVERLVACHMYDKDGKTSENKVRLFVAHNMDIIPKLVDLIKADRMATGMYEDELGEHRFERIYNQIIADIVPTKLSHLAVDGHTAVDLGLTGSQISKALNSALNECILNPKLNNVDWLTKFLKSYKS
ncbi:MAG: HD domain-containing protein [Firmicutes bacterium]|nr:HD domain-containing protein [Bacillota bacterium]